VSERRTPRSADDPPDLATGGLVGVRDLRLPEPEPALERLRVVAPRDALGERLDQPGAPAAEDDAVRHERLLEDLHDLDHRLCRAVDILLKRPVVEIKPGQAREHYGAEVYAVHSRFTPFKNDIVWLVGFAGKHRGHPVLGTHKAYDVVYWKLRNAVAGDRRGD
jgi:hypothetical protein